MGNYYSIIADIELSIGKKLKNKMIHAQAYKVKKGKITKLSLRSCGIKKLSDIKSFEKLTDLEYLNLAGNEITEIIPGVENVMNHTGLKKEEAQSVIKYCQVSSTPKTFKKLPDGENKEKELLEQFKKVINLTQTIQISRAAQMLDLTEEALNKKLLQWADHISFKVNDGKILVNDLNQFMDDLDSQFDDWENNENSGTGKK